MSRKAMLGFVLCDMAFQECFCLFLGLKGQNAPNETPAWYLYYVTWPFGHTFHFFSGEEGRCSAGLFKRSRKLPGAATELTARLLPRSCSPEAPEGQRRHGIPRET